MNGSVVNGQRAHRAAWGTTALAQYLPPDPQRMELARQAGNLSVNPVDGAAKNLLVVTTNSNYQELGGP